MELINNHIELYLNKFVEYENLDFDLFSKIDNYQKKNRYKKLLNYIDNLIQLNNNPDANQISVLHIHFENDFDKEIELLIFQLIIIKLFNKFQSREIELSNTDTLNLSIKKNELQRKYNQLDCSCPEGASRKNGGNRIYKNWANKKGEINCLLGFYKSLNNSSVFSNKALINCQVWIKNEILNTFKINPFAADINSNYFDLTYNALNSDKKLDEIDSYHNFLDNIEDVILFDCENKRLMSNFSMQEITKWNTEYGTNFKKYLVLTFGKEVHSFQKIRNKIDIIKEKFKIPNYTSYTVLSSEFDILLCRKKKIQIPVEFIGFENASFWEVFLLETSIRELYELRSIKMMNIYSLCFSEEIKKYILEELFSNVDSSKIISYNTKQAILELREDDLNLIKESLITTLDLIINSELKSKVTEMLDNETFIILEDSVIKDKILIAKITNSLSLLKSNKLISWSDLNNSTNNSILILTYRDQGKFPNYFYPNVIESSISSENIVSAIYLNFFFGKHYQWSKYNLYRDFHKYLNHPIRQNNFEWNKLKLTIETIRPTSKLNIDWNLEYEFSNSDNRETYKVKLKGERAKTYNSSDLFIFKHSEESSYKVNKISNVLALEQNGEKYFLQNLDNIQEDINIYDKIADTKQQENELNIISKQFNLDKESAGRLWKILLKNIADIEGDEKLYNDLKIHLENKGLKIVSLFHFKNSWINTQSESIAPLNKMVFISLCDYLKIPKTYFIIIQRIRNSSKQSSRQSTRQMNQLLKDLFNDGCFNEGINVRDILKNKLSVYKMNHPLDELGIDENHLLDNLVTLTELIQPELKLLELEKIEKIEQ